MPAPEGSPLPTGLPMLRGEIRRVDLDVDPDLCGPGTAVATLRQLTGLDEETTWNAVAPPAS
ncbi:MAG: hypothetical protein ACRCYX_06050 [Dermatophilaceae bacterium]